MKLTRREFIKTAAVLSGAVGATALSSPKVLKALSEMKSAPQQGEERLATLTCPGGGCHQSCALRAHVQDGRIVNVEAAPMPIPDDTHACIRGLASWELPYLPDRLKYPMKRVGERGEGKWEPISWDEALDMMAQKMSAIKESHGPEAIAWVGSYSSSVPLGGVNAGAMTARFANLFGCSEVVGWPIDGDGFCASFANYGFLFGGGNDSRDWANSRLLIIWGENMALSAMRHFKHVLEAKERGMRVIVVSPFFDNTAAKADQWIPIRPATDGALALSMINVMVKNELYDSAYIKRYTVGPFLVRNDNGHLLKESDITAEGSEENYVVWDTISGIPIAVPPHVSELPDVEPALLGDFTAGGVKCRPAFQLLADRAAEYSPEAAAKICEVPAETISRLAVEYATSKPAALRFSHGLGRYLHGDLNQRAVLALGAISGNVGIPGGGVGSGSASYPAMLNSDPVNAADDKRSNRIHISTGYNAIVTGEPNPIKAWVIWGSNPINGIPNAKMWTEKLVPGLDFIVVVDLVETWTAKYADLLLPGTCIYERTDIHTNLSCAILTQQPIEPLYERKSDIDIIKGLADRLGLGKYFTNTTEEYIEMMLDHPTLKGITLERLQKEGGVVRANYPLTPAVMFADKQFPSPSGRIEFYYEMLKEAGEELPSHKEPAESPRSSLAQKHPLHFYTGRNKFWTQTMSYYPMAREIKKEPRLNINVVDANKRGIKDEDIVRVYNDRGQMKLKARINESMRPGSVWVEHGWWPKDFIEGHYQDLLRPSSAPGPDMLTPSFQYYWSVFEGFARATPNALMAPFGISDQLFDCLVEVEKA